MNEVDKQYLDAIKYVLKNGEKRSDRTGVGTTSVFGYQMRFDLANGFPLLTTKRVYWKGVVEELLFFISGETNENVLSENGINIWREWADQNGNLGPIYGHTWRNFGGKHKNRKQPIPNRLRKMALIRMPDEKEIMVNNSNEKYYIVDEVKNNKKIKIQFIDTGNVIITRLDKIKNGAIRDCYSADRCGVACIGMPDINHIFYKSLYVLWCGMIDRCYNRLHEHYHCYGGRGVYVDDKWLIFENFLYDVKNISGWVNKIANWNEYELDKDIYSDGFCYSLTTTAWVHKNENINAKYKKIFIIKHKTGRIEYIKNANQFIKVNKYSQGNFNAMLRKERKNANGWTLIGERDNNIGFDQLENIINQIKTQPDSRRLLISAWDPSIVEHQALPPCHFSYQFYVSKNKKLSCRFIMRSTDLFLGFSFNLASYALLTHMIAQICNLEVGELIFQAGDLHIYDNHIDQVNEQLLREPRKLPILLLDKSIKNIDDFRSEHIKLIDYDPHPTIKAKVAV